MLSLSSSRPSSHRSALNHQSQLLAPPPLSLEDINRLRYAYPQKVHIPKAFIPDGSLSWSCSLVGKFLGRCPPAEIVSRRLGTLWSLQGEWELFPMNHGFFVFHFTSSSNRDRVLLEGPWVLDVAVLFVGPWTPSFLQLQQLFPMLFSRFACRICLLSSGHDNLLN